jgi:DNA-binding transcriptional regulator YiaG
MTINDSTRIRVIRALIGMSSKDFAERIGVSSWTMTAYERGRSAPQGKKRDELAKLCQEHGLAFLPSGMPVSFSDCLLFKNQED